MKKIKAAIIGGAKNSLFGSAHHKAISMDMTRELVAGAISSNPKKSVEEAGELDIRGFANYSEMIDAYKNDRELFDYVTIVTPNDHHYLHAKACIENGIPIVCEKPLTLNAQEAVQLGESLKSSPVPFVLCHTYTGFPMVMLAREFVRNGEIGQVRKVESWYRQGWLARPVENVWRLDPQKSGVSCCGGDIGTHALVAATWVTGQKVKQLSARLNSFVENRVLDDDFNVMAELDNGATAIITATQVAIGYKNDNGFRIFGSKGSIEWHQERGEKLLVRRGGADQIYWTGAEFDYFPETIKPYLRLPGGHHEDFLEALANLHLTMELTIRKGRNEKNVPEPYPHPGIDEGIEGMKFIEAAVKSSQQNGAYVQLV